MTDAAASFYEKLIRKPRPKPKHALGILRYREVHIAVCECGWQSKRGCMDQVSRWWSQHVAEEESK
jgi:hypothetical protein